MKKSILTLLLASTLAMATRNMENLDRGLVAVKVSNGIFLSWRVLGTDAASTTFNLYRDGTRIASFAAGVGTNYVDASGTTTSKYTVRAVVNGTEQTADAATTPRPNAWLSIPLKPPGSGYTPNDASAGDLDGDGQYEIILKWDPSDSKDNSLSGNTGNVYIDAYKLNGTRLWRIDLGQNIRAGAHYTQFQVADYDGDGKAEMMVKTAPGTKDGSGSYLSKGTAAGASNTTDYANSSGYILSGPEWLTVFNGQTGKEMATVDYVPARGTVSSWGDSYGNRVDRFLAATAWLGNGKNPSAVFQRGYYTRMAITAWDWDGTTLKQRWAYDAKTSGSECYGQGNHNLSVGDVDFDGYDEIIEGACAVDHNGKFMYRTGFGHGDAMHLGKMMPNNDTLMVWEVHESDNTHGEELHNALTGHVYWYNASSGDNGRGMAGDIDSAHPGYEMWSFGNVTNAGGTVVSSSRPSVNFRVYWDGDLYDEIFDNVTIAKWNGTKAVGMEYLNIYPNSSNPVLSNNTTKATPCLVADLFGDWREEIVMRTTNSDSLIIFTTTIPTPYRLYTLMHDPVYRCAVAWQNSAYNQPPHLGFWLGAGVAKAPKPDIALVGAPIVPANNPPVFTSGKSFSIPENTTAVVQCAATDPEGTAVTYTIAGGEDSTLFTIGKATGVLAFKAAPDFEKPTDNGADNIYKVMVAASDGVNTTTQSISILVTDVVDETTSLDSRSGVRVPAHVVWLDIQGNVLGQEDQLVDPAHPRPAVPAGLRGAALARVSIGADRTTVALLPGSR
jgi:rhamnogalacturonan endolyase